MVDRRYERGTDVLPTLEAMEGRVGLQADALSSGIQLVEPSRGTHKGAAGTKSGDKVGNVVFGLLPNLERGGLIVRAPICRIAVLIGIEIPLRIAGVNLARPAYGSIGARVSGSQDDLGAVGRQNSLSLRAGVRGEAEHDGLSRRRSNHGVCEPRIAAHGVQNGLAGAK